MARIRSLHPGQWTDEQFVSVSAFARLLALALRNEADDQGVFEWKPVGLKMRLFPADAIDMSALLSELEGADIIRGFSMDGRRYGAIRNFQRFQRPKKPNHLYPMTDEIRTYVASPASSSEPVPNQDDDEVEPVPPQSPKVSADVGGRRKEEGCNPPSVGESASPSAPASASSKAKGSRLPSDWELPDDWRSGTTSDLLARGVPLGSAMAWITQTADNFRDHWLQSSRPTAIKRDWQAAWRVWVRKEIADGRIPPPSAAPSLVSSAPPEKRLREATLDEQELARRVRRVCGRMTCDADVAEWRKLDEVRTA